MNDEHSKLFPFSSAARWSGDACPGSVAMCLDEPDEDTEQSREGTAAHWVFEVMLGAYKRKVTSDGVEEGRRLIGVSHPNNHVVITEEMFDAALAFYDIITKVAVNKDALVVEYRVHAPSIDEDAWGTLDVAYYDAQSHTVYLWDFKFGHLRVKAHKNKQLTGYAQALCETWQMQNDNPRLVLGVFQPRCYDGGSLLQLWETTLDDLRGIVNHLRAGCESHRAGTAMLNPGLPWCRDCRARYKCPADLRACAADIDASFKPIGSPLTDTALAYEMDLAEDGVSRLKKRLEALEAEAERRMQSGTLLPGRRRQETYGRDQWSIPADRVAEVCNMFSPDVDVMKPPEAKTPAQVIALLKKKGVDGAVISPYHGKTKSGSKIVRDDGTRAEQIFSGGKFTHE